MFRVEIETDNAAFDDQPATEIARILREIAKRVNTGDGDGLVRDENGNTVARFTS